MFCCYVAVTVQHGHGEPSTKAHSCITYLPQRSVLRRREGDYLTIDVDSRYTALSTSLFDLVAEGHGPMPTAAGPIYLSADFYKGERDYMTVDIDGRYVRGGDGMS